MKLVATIALGAALTATSAANAQQVVHETHAAPHPMPIVESATTVYSTPVRRRARYTAPSRSFFGELMDLERRKNAWLKRTFLGR